MRNTARRDMLSFALPGFVVLSVAMGVSGWDLVRRQGSLAITSAHNVVGLTLLGVGLAIMLIAQATLWRFYSSTLVIRDGHRLITHGIYRLARHPIYLGATLGLMGVPVYVSSLYGLLAMSLLVPLFLHRIRMEERMLAEEFGDAHREYCRSARKLIPFIY